MSDEQIGNLFASARGIDFVLDVTHCDEMDRVGEFKRYFDNVNAIDTALV